RSSRPSPRVKAPPSITRPRATAADRPTPAMFLCQRCFMSSPRARVPIHAGLEPKDARRARRLLGSFVPTQAEAEVDETGGSENEDDRRGEAAQERPSGPTRRPSEHGADLLVELRPGTALVGPDRRPQA